MEEKHVTKEEVWAGFARLEALNEQNARGLEELKEQVAQTAKVVKDLGTHLGRAANHNGDAAEEYFANTLMAKKEFAGQHYDYADRNLHRNRNGREDEFDIIMYNGVSIGLIEVKYKADLDDVDDLATRKVENFRLFFPEHKDKVVYLGIGSMSFDEKVLKRARIHGIAILRQKKAEPTTKFLVP
jgi:Holliday junction resolvase-like predicted endonuclease